MGDISKGVFENNSGVHTVDTTGISTCTVKKSVLWIRIRLSILMPIQIRVLPQVLHMFQNEIF
jgi:hypothetical protein